MRGMRFAGRTDPSLVREFFRRHRLPESPENFRRFYDRYAFLLDHELHARSGQVCPGVRRWLTELAALPEPPRLGLLTGNIRLGAEIKLRHYGLWGCFETGAFGDDHEDRNALAGVAVERGRRLLGADLTPAEVLVVGDTPLDIACARAAQARALAVATGGATLEELRAHAPDWLAPDLEALHPHEVCA